jgi:RimJ/RimL family protein N-acetyltransferase
MTHTHLLDIETALLTERTVFRRVREGEGAAFYKLFQENRVRLKDYFWTLSAQVNTEPACELWVRKKLADWLKNEAYFFGIWDKNTALLIGFISLEKVDWSLPRAEVEFFIDKKHGQKGIMTEVLNQLIEFAFDQLKMQKLALRTAMEYYPPQRLARKCGFNREGDLRAEYRKPSGEMMDVMLFGLAFTTYEKY